MQCKVYLCERSCNRHIVIRHRECGCSSRCICRCSTCNRPAVERIADIGRRSCQSYGSCIVNIIDTCAYSRCITRLDSITTIRRSGVGDIVLIGCKVCCYGSVSTRGFDGGRSRTGISDCHISCAVPRYSPTCEMVSGVGRCLQRSRDDMKDHSCTAVCDCFSIDGNGTMTIVSESNAVE